MTIKAIYLAFGAKWKDMARNGLVVVSFYSSLQPAASSHGTGICALSCDESWSVPFRCCCWPLPLAVAVFASRGHGEIFKCLRFLRPRVYAVCSLRSQSGRLRSRFRAIKACHESGQNCDNFYNAYSGCFFAFLALYSTQQCCLSDNLMVTMA